MTPPVTAGSVKRVRIICAILLVICLGVVIRFFYLQVIRHDHYHAAAQRGQMREYEIPATRGVIEAYNGGEIIPLVLNETKYTLFADPLFIEDADEVAEKLTSIIGGDAEKLAQQMDVESRYVILAKKLDKPVKEKIDALEIKGIGTRETSHRTYPHGQLAAQLLGFVNDEGRGNYGLEQVLDERLSGKPGLLKAITDVNGVPLAANEDNILLSPRNGERIRLTIDVALQARTEEILRNKVKSAGGSSGSAVVMDVRTGAIAAMANFPTYNPSEFYKVKDHKLFNNSSVTDAIEPGSTMKSLIVAAGLDSGVIGRDSTYYDPNEWEFDGKKIRNIDLIRGAETRSIQDILSRSINTGSTWVLMQMGGGELNQKGRQSWYDYMTKRFRLGRPTGIEQNVEGAGSIPSPTQGFGLNLQYANSTFGQGMSATPLQMAAALSSAVNGGKYYQPHLVEQKSGPKLLEKNVISERASRDLAHLLEVAYKASGMARPRDGYRIGGKTGSAQVADPRGGYYADRFIGTYIGYVGKNSPRYVVMVRVSDPKLPGYAGTVAARPVFEDIVEFMINASMAEQ